MTSPTIAANAYASLAKIGGGLGQTAAGLGAGLGGATSAGGPSFGNVLKEVVEKVAESSRKSDAQAQAMAAGKANVVDVVTAVAETEVAIDAIVAVRDRVIQSYEEIMRMPI